MVQRIIACAILQTSGMLCCYDLNLKMNVTVRTVLGVLVGDVIFAGSAALLFYFTRTDPQGPATPGFILFCTLYGIGFALLGGFVAGKIGARQDLITGLLLAAIIAIAAISTAITHPGQGAIWSQMFALVLMSPAALFGDWLRKNRM